MLKIFSWIIKHNANEKLKNYSNQKIKKFTNGKLSQLQFKNHNLYRKLSKMIKKKFKRTFKNLNNLINQNR